MLTLLLRKHNTSLKANICRIILAAFVATSVCPPQYSYAQAGITLPEPGKMVKLTPQFMPPVLKGIKVDPKNPLAFNFLIDPGQTKLSKTDKETEYTTLVKYFLASLTTSEKDMWVNLSPYESKRIISDDFGTTEMGRNMLAQDYILKQLTASLMYPEDALGKKFWNRIYSRARSELGNTQIPVNTFNKVWILPKSATILEKGNLAVVTASRLTVMVDEDYLALDKNSNGMKMGLSESMKAKGVKNSSSQIIRDIIVPEIEREVNEGANFAQLRQMYNSMVLASWFKQRLKKHVLSQMYVNQNKTDGVQLEDMKDNDRVYQQYLKAFKKGVYNYIKEEPDAITGQVVPRKYFSGGFTAASMAMTVRPADIEGPGVIGVITDPTQQQLLGALKDNLFEQVVVLLQDTSTQPLATQVLPQASLVEAEQGQQVAQSVAALVGTYAATYNNATEIAVLTLSHIDPYTLAALATSTEKGEAFLQAFAEELITNHVGVEASTDITNQAHTLIIDVLGQIIKRQAKTQAFPLSAPLSLAQKQQLSAAFLHLNSSRTKGSSLEYTWARSAADTKEQAEEMTALAQQYIADAEAAAEEAEAFSLATRVLSRFDFRNATSGEVADALIDALSQARSSATTPMSKEVLGYVITLIEVMIKTPAGQENAVPVGAFAALNTLAQTQGVTAEELRDAVAYVQDPGNLVQALADTMPGLAGKLTTDMLTTETTPALQDAIVETERSARNLHSEQEFADTYRGLPNVLASEMKRAEDNVTKAQAEFDAAKVKLQTILSQIVAPTTAQEAAKESAAKEAAAAEAAKALANIAKIAALQAQTLTPETPVTQSMLKQLYFGFISGVVAPIIAQFKAKPAINPDDFSTGMDQVAQALGQPEVSDVLRQRVRGESIKGKNQVGFATVVAAFIANQARLLSATGKKVTNIYLPRDMGLGYTIEQALKAVNGADAQPDIYYVSTPSMGSAYMTIKTIIYAAKSEADALANVSKEERRKAFIKSIGRRIFEYKASANSPEQFKKVITQIEADIVELGYDKLESVRFVDTGFLTFPLMMEGIMAHKHDIETDGLVMASSLKDMLPQLDPEQWTATAQEIATSGDYGKFAKASLALEDTNNFPHPIRYDEKQGGMVATSVDTQMEALGTQLVFVQGALNYELIIQGIVELLPKETPEAEKRQIAQETVSKLLDQEQKPGSDLDYMIKQSSIQSADEGANLQDLFKANATRAADFLKGKGATVADTWADTMQQQLSKGFELAQKPEDVKTEFEFFSPAPTPATPKTPTVAQPSKNKRAIIGMALATILLIAGIINNDKIQQWADNFVGVPQITENTQAEALLKQRKLDVAAAKEAKRVADDNVRKANEAAAQAEAARQAAVQQAEKDRLAKEAAEAAKAQAEAERVQAEAARQVALQQAEQDRLAKVAADEAKAKAEATAKAALEAAKNAGQGQAPTVTPAVAKPAITPEIEKQLSTDLMKALRDLNSISTLRGTNDVAGVKKAAEALRAAYGPGFNPGLQNVENALKLMDAPFFKMNLANANAGPGKGVNTLQPKPGQRAHAKTIGQVDGLFADAEELLKLRIGNVEVPSKPGAVARAGNWVFENALKTPAVAVAGGTVTAGKFVAKQAKAVRGVFTPDPKTPEQVASTNIVVNKVIDTLQKNPGSNLELKGGRLIYDVTVSEVGTQEDGQPTAQIRYKRTPGGSVFSTIFSRRSNGGTGFINPADIKRIHNPKTSEYFFLTNQPDTTPAINDAVAEPGLDVTTTQLKRYPGSTITFKGSALMLYDVQIKSFEVSEDGTAGFKADYRRQPDGSKYTGFFSSDDIKEVLTKDGKKLVQPDATKPSASATPVGGIDFDDKYLKMNLEGNGMDLPVPQAYTWLLNTPIKGFYPQIVEMSSGTASTLSFFKGVLTSK